jgi:hypothetical protein
MRRKQGQKARYKLSPIEHEYLKTFGIMPDLHYQKLKREGMPPEEIPKLIQTNIDQCYAQMRKRHDNSLLSECPFD